jgi:predicted acylesterase/phospholipase RssA
MTASGKENNNHKIENVLIFQGGGSLGAFGCGVFKGFTNSRVKVDIIAGTSIGGVNAAILAGAKDDRPERALEQFWLELAEFHSLYSHYEMGVSLPAKTNARRKASSFSIIYQL